jgi:hypothetical protein
MSNDRSRRSAGIRRSTLVTAIAVLASLVALGAASSALAAPKGIFKVFTNCPTTEPGVQLCSYSEVTSGKFVIGSTEVPINKPIILQGGAIPTGINLNEFFLVPPSNGTEALSKTELNVPGGLLDLVNCEEIKGSGLWEIIERGSCKLIFENGTTGVTAVTESAGSTTNPPILNLSDLIFESGTALTLPVKVHLKNPLLGNSCYIGSEAHPIQLHLTTGTTSPPGPNKPIKGTAGKGSVEEEVVEGKELEVDVQTGASLVDNSFSVPKAEGCGEFFSFLIDPIVDAKLGLESAAGKNTAIQTGNLRIASAEYVKDSEK